MAGLTPGKPVVLQQGTGNLTVQLTGTAQCGVVLMGMYELVDGSKGMVQAWDWEHVSIGHLDEPPFVYIPSTWLSVPKGHVEKRLEINLKHAAKIRKLVIFAAIRDEDSKWSDVRCPAVTVMHPQQGIFDFRLGHTRFGLPRLRRRFCRTCVLATLEFNVKDGVVLTPRDAYFAGLHQQIADAYNMGMTFTPTGCRA